MSAPRHPQLLSAILLSICVCLAIPATRADDDAVLRVAVAANFRSTAEELGRLFEKDSGMRVVFSSASTGVLAAQLRSGAPFDVLLAADAARPAALHREGLALDAPQCYAVGALVLLGADDTAALADSALSLAIANPVTAPYGAAAAEVLALQRFAAGRGRRVLRASNVMQAHQFFHSGAADLALVARSLAPDTAIPIPRAWHAPIRQFALISATTTQPERARALLQTITGTDAANVLAARGYAPCS